MQSVERLTRSAKETFEVARQLGEELAGGEVLALVGDLGAGKTTFTRGLVCGTGCEEYMRVNSPTYVLEQVYQGRIPVRHYDAYRLDSPYELEDLGFQEALSTEAVLVIEWADRVQSLLPADSLLLELSFASPDGTYRWTPFFAVLDVIVKKFRICFQLINKRAFIGLLRI